MQCQVVYSKGKSHLVAPIEKCESALSLKKWIARELNIHHTHLRTVFDGDVIDDGVKWRDTHIVPCEDVIRVEECSVQMCRFLKRLTVISTAANVLHMTFFVTHIHIMQFVAFLVCMASAGFVHSKNRVPLCTRRETVTRLLLELADASAASLCILICHHSTPEPNTAVLAAAFIACAAGSYWNASALCRASAVLALGSKPMMAYAAIMFWPAVAFASARLCDRIIQKI